MREIDALIAEHVMGEVVGAWPWECHSYSADIAEAWRVVEKMRDTHVIRITDEAESGGFWVEYMDGAFNVVTALHDSAPMAICLAALKAVNVSIEEAV